MEYVYAALVLHEAGKDVTEDNVTAILEAGDIEVDDARVKSLVAALDDIDIEEAMAEQAAAPVAAGGAGGAGGADEADEADEAEEEEAAEEEAEDDDDEDEGDAGEGLGELFG